MSIRRKGKMIKCPECNSENLVVIETRKYDCGTLCRDCDKKFLTGSPIIIGTTDFWKHSKDTAEWI